MPLDILFFVPSLPILLQNNYHTIPKRSRGRRSRLEAGAEGRRPLEITESQGQADARAG